tara:strand:- start:110 stop:1060 length:951 start_codon:yes stop_codon:yes gene_type:complete
MSQTETYANLLSLIESYHGATLIDIEKTRVRHLVNSRARAAYRESDLWDPFLVTAEERVVDDSNPDQMFVPYVGTTSADTSVTSIKKGDIDTVLRAHNANPFAVNSVREYEVMATSNGIELPGYKVVYGASNVIKYWASGLGIAAINLQSKTDCIVGGTVKIENVTTASDSANLIVNDTFTITSITDQVDTPTDDTLAGIVHAFSIQTSSSDISTATASFPVVYLTYKRRLTETYGDQDGDTTTVPMEWKDYIALGVYADMLASDGFVEKSLATEARAAKALQVELERVERNRANQFVNQRIRTHGSDQNRQTSSL